MKIYSGPAREIMFSANVLCDVTIRLKILVLISQSTLVQYNGFTDNIHL